MSRALALSPFALLVSLPLVGCGPPTLVDVQRDVFTPRCANAACHAGDAAPLRLDLSEGNAYDNIVGVDAVAVAGAVRVVPGDPEASLLFQVTEAPVEGVRKMPVGFSLTGAERELLREWIAAGALRE